MADDLRFAVETEYGDSGLQAARADTDAFAGGLDAVVASSQDLNAEADRLASSLDTAAAGLDSVVQGTDAVAAGFADAGDGASSAAAGLDHVVASAEEVAAAEQRVAAETAKATESTVNQGRATEVSAESQKKLVAGIGLAATAVTAIGLALGVATSKAADYQRAVTTISTLSTESADRFQEYKSSILDVSSALGQDAVTSANAAYNAISSGIDPGAAVGFLQAASTAATAGLTTVDSASSALTVTLNSFNLKASETTNVSDALFATANVGVTTFGELAGSFGGVASIAAASNATYQETLAALAQVTTKGFGTAEAVTALKATFVSLSKPSAEVQAALEAQGFASADAAIKARGLQFVLELVRQTSIDTGKPLINLVGSAEAVNAVLATTGDNAAAARDKVAAVGSAAGSTQAAFDLISETPAQKMAVFESSVNAAAITTGDVFLPILTAILDAFTPLVQGFTHGAQVVASFTDRFNDLPEPIRLVVGGLTGLLGVSAAGATGLIGLAAAAQPVIKTFGLQEQATDLAGKALGSIVEKAGGVKAALTAAVGPVAIVVAVLGTLKLALDAGDEALQKQYDSLSNTAGFDAYVEAVARARQETGLFTGVGVSLREGLSNAGDDWRVLVDDIGGAIDSAGRWISSLGSATTATHEARGEVKASTNDILEAGRAWLESGTNLDPAVAGSAAFKTAVARLNQEVRLGKLDQEEYKNALLNVADGFSVAAGKGEVLNRSQQVLAVGHRSALDAAVAQASGLSEAAVASEEFKAREDELVASTARGKISREAATQELLAFGAELTRQDSAYQQAITNNAEFNAAYAETRLQLAGGQVSFVDAQQRVQALGEQYGIAADKVEEAIGRVVSTGGGLSDSLRGAGVTLDLVTIGDPEKLSEAIGQAKNTADSAIASAFSDQLAARRKLEADLAAAQEDGGKQRKALEDKAQAEIAKAQASGNSQRAAELRKGLADDLAKLDQSNADRLASIRSSFEQERQERLASIAQAALDQVNSLLRLGQISEQQAQAVFGSLKAAAPDSTLFDPAAEAALKFSGTLGRALSADATAGDIVALGEGLKNVDAALDESVAHADAYAAQSTAAYDAVRAAAETSGGQTISVDQAVDAANATRTNAVVANAAAEGEQRLVLAGTAQAAAATHASADALVVDSSNTRTAGVQAGTAAQSAALQEGAAVTSDTSNRVQGDLGRAGDAGIQLGEDLAVGAARGSSAFKSAGDDIAGHGGAIATGARTAGTAAGTGFGEGVRVGVVGALPAFDQVGAAATKSKDTVVAAGAEAKAAAAARVEGEEAAAAAAESGADTQAQSLDAVVNSSTKLRKELGELKTAVKAVPLRIPIVVGVSGIPSVRKALGELRADVAAATGIFRLIIRGTYSGSGAAQDGHSLLLQHNIEDAIAAAAPGVHIDGTYEGDGVMAENGDGAVGLEDVIRGLREQFNEPVVFTADAAIGRNLAALLGLTDGIDLHFADDVNADLATIEQQIAVVDSLIGDLDERAQIPVDKLGIKFRELLTGGTADVGSVAWFIQQLTSGSLAGSAGVDLGAIFEGLNLETPVSNLQEFLALIQSMADEPRDQAELWGLFFGELMDQENRRYQERKSNLEKEKDAAAGNEGHTREAEEALQALEDQHKDIVDRLNQQNDFIQRQVDSEGRLNGLIDDQQKRRDALVQQQQQLLKLAEDLVKTQAKAAVDAEKGVHDNAISLLDEEMRRHEEANGRLMRWYDERKKAIEGGRAVERAKQDGIIQGIEDEATARKDLFKSESAQGFIDDAKAALKKLDLAGVAGLTLGERTILAQLGLDAAGLEQLGAGVEETKRQVDSLSELFDKLPDEKNVRIRLVGQEQFNAAGARDRRGQAALKDDERTALQGALDSGKVADADRRIVELALAGRSVNSARLKEIVDGLVTKGEDEVQVQQDLVDLAEKKLGLVELEESARKAALDVDLQGIEQRKTAAEAAAKVADDAFVRRLSQLDTERSESQARYADERKALEDVKEAEKKRHEERVAQINREAALQLLALGKTPEQVQQILAEQARQATRLAEEARARFAAMLDELDRRRREIEEENARIAESARLLGSAPPPTVAPPTTPSPTLPPGTAPPGVPPILPPPSALGETAASSDELARSNDVLSDSFGTLADSAAGAAIVLDAGFWSPMHDEATRMLALTDRLRDSLESVGRSASRLSGLSINVEGGAGGGGRTVIIQGDVNIFDRDTAVEAGLLDAVGAGRN